MKTHRFATLAQARLQNPEAFDKAIHDAVRQAAEMVGTETTLRALTGPSRKFRRTHQRG